MQKKNFLVLALLGLFCIVYFWAVPAYEEKKNTEMEAKQIADMKEELSQIWEGYKVAVKESGTMVSKKEKIDKYIVRLYDMTLNTENMEKTIRQGNRAEYTFLQQYEQHISDAIMGRIILYGSQISGLRPDPLFLEYVNKMPYSERMAEKFYRMAKGNTNNVGQDEKLTALPSNRPSIGFAAASSVPALISGEDMKLCNIKVRDNNKDDVIKIWGQPKEIQRSGSKEMTGIFDLYKYEGFEVLIADYDKQVVRIQINDPKIMTPRGIKIGDSFAQVLDAYGMKRNDQKVGRGKIIWHKFEFVQNYRASRLTFIVEYPSESGGSYNEAKVVGIVCSILPAGP